MTDSIEIKYRTWFKGLPPKPIKLQMDGWAGETNKHMNGDKPQPWHCIPFVEGSTYGLELIYPFDSDCVVSCKDGIVTFEGNFTHEDPWTQNGETSPPFSMFAPNHYGFTSSLDLMPPEGYVTRLESHPRFYTDTTGTVPIVVPGHIQRWWARIFFIVFKAPLEGQTHIFRHNEPYGQVLFLPKKMNYEIKEMTEEEQAIRAKREADISNYDNELAGSVWTDFMGNKFDDKYKQLGSAYAKKGDQGINEMIFAAKEERQNGKAKIIKKKIKRKLIKNEGIQAKKEKWAKNTNLRNNRGLFG